MELVGKKFNDLTVLEYNDTLDEYKCQCKCGVKILTNDVALIYSYVVSCTGDNLSCPISDKTKTSSEEVSLMKQSYRNMKERCYNPDSSRYANYGGRGITVCKRWLDGFLYFYNDMSSDFKKGFQIDRVDNDKGYSKENCRWVTPQQNSYNRGTNSNSTSKYKGVSWCSKNKKWNSKVSKDGVSYSLGRYENEEEAALVYNKKASELFGKYAYLNKLI